MDNMNVIKKFSQPIYKCIHCSVLSQVEQIVSLLKEYQIKGDVTTWQMYKENTCYLIKGKKLFFGDRQVYEKVGYQIISFDEFMKGVS